MLKVKITLEGHYFQGLKNCCALPVPLSCGSIVPKKIKKQLNRTTYETTSRGSQSFSRGFNQRNAHHSYIQNTGLLPTMTSIVFARMQKAQKAGNAGTSAKVSSCKAGGKMLKNKATQRCVRVNVYVNQS
jgi:hypothetical protein